MKDLFLKIILLLYWLIIGIFFTYGGIVIYLNNTTADKVMAVVSFLLALISYIAVFGLIKYWKD